MYLTHVTAAGVCVWVVVVVVVMRGIMSFRYPDDLCGFQQGVLNSGANNYDCRFTS